ncbi:hypothetical protein FB45DRAFT_912725 [Roridomyces roridus]|uniref:Fe2OG dioxygenase domain-containing protein n=1 Tax=Roridomyces roridus TaxID=1738132 RepID=A0AAD7BWM3_9AGAR|nr:hypothetical protein FB45DRAFT_912725 [Roridomyces roridus]
MKDSSVELDWTPFRAAEKRFKARFPPPDLSQDVLDLALLNATRASEIEAGIWKGTTSGLEYRKLTGDVEAYVTPRIPGLVLLPGFLDHATQRALVQWSLADHARQPNETNLDIHYVLPEDGLWNPSGPRKLINNTPATLENFSELSATPKLPSAPSGTAQPTLASALIRKLRWANIGWSYHWGTKQYDFAKGKVKVDESLAEVCRKAVNAVDWKQVYGPTDASDWGESGPGWQTWDQDYEPDAGIVNFYQTKDTLMAHVDRSEVCATSPLVSISIGNAAVFLIGGLTRDSDPVPILLRSGDVVIMSGPTCRRAYHGVPRILENTLPDHLTGQGPWAPYEDYLTTTRININVRQVFPKGFDPS